MEDDTGASQAVEEYWKQARNWAAPRVRLIRRWRSRQNRRLQQQLSQLLTKIRQQPRRLWWEAGGVLVALLIGVGVGNWVGNLGNQGQSEATASQPVQSVEAGLADSSNRRRPNNQLAGPRPETPTKTNRPATSRRQATTPNTTQRPDSAGQQEDWAQNAPLPPWVADTSFQITPRPNPREPTGSQNYSLQNGGSSGQAPATRERTGTSLSADQLQPLLLRRVSGPRLSTQPLTDQGDPGGTDNLQILGRCGQQISLNQQGAREKGTTSSWLFALAVSPDHCRKASGLAANHQPPTRDQRRRLAYITQSSSVARRLGAPSFSPSDLTDFASYQQGDNTFAFGVFRRQMNTTQVSPAPPVPQLAFVAQRKGGQDWEILWGTFTSDPDRRVGLAGVYDQDGDDIMDAYFGVIGGGRPYKALHISSSDGLSWGVEEVLNFAQ